MAHKISVDEVVEQYLEERGNVGSIMAEALLFEENMKEWSEPCPKCSHEYLDHELHCYRCGYDGVEEAWINRKPEEY